MTPSTTCRIPSCLVPPCCRAAADGRTSSCSERPPWRWIPKWSWLSKCGLAKSNLAKSNLAKSNRVLLTGLLLASLASVAAATRG